MSSSVLESGVIQATDNDSILFPSASLDDTVCEESNVACKSASKFSSLISDASTNPGESSGTSFD